MLVVPNVTRYTVVGTVAGNGWATRVDMEIIDAPIGARSDFVDDVARRVLESWDTHLKEHQNGQVVLQRVEWLDINSAEGGTGEETTSGAITWPTTGGNPGAAMPGNVSYLITKQAVTERSHRQGRMYLTGVAENLTDTSFPNQLTGTTVVAMQASADAFLAMVNSGESGYDTNMVVVHADPIPDPENPPAIQGGSYSRVSGLAVQQTLATQRRRLRD